MKDATRDAAQSIGNTVNDLTDKVDETLENAGSEILSSPGAVKPVTTTSNGEDKPSKSTGAASDGSSPNVSPAIMAQQSAKSSSPAKVMTPSRVKSAQTELKRLDYNVGVDGAYGPNTKKVIMTFQSTHGLPVDGVVTPALVTALKAAPTPVTIATSEPQKPPAEPQKAALIKIDDTPTPPKTEKVVKIAATETYVEKDKATLMATLSPVGKMAFENCESLDSLLYSCSCVGEKVNEMVPDVQKNWLAQIDKEIKFMENAIENLKARPASKPLEARIQHYNMMIDRSRKKYASVHNRDDWDNHMRRDIWGKSLSELLRTRICRQPDGVRKNAFDRCMKGANPTQVSDNEDYCHCVSDTQANLWMKVDPRTPPSQALTWAINKAWKQCTP